MSIRSTVTGEVITTSFQLLSHGPVAANHQGHATIEFPNVTLRPAEYALSFHLTDQFRDKTYDLIDEHVDVPWLSIDMDTPSLQPEEGYVSLPSRLVAS